MSAACKWCGGRGHHKPLWHRNCLICGVSYTQERGVKRPRETCGKPLCRAVQRYRQVRGRLPPREWIIAYAAKANLIKLPKKVAKIAARCAA